ncbi:hypothetical protein N7456_000402 [Penicillium angulare]|uniref:Uncharacterized protein n=1 Tax=Penicillium angulare TaxID=116970 RepID=A0A9W9GBZ0_9EURO|nr:hypothetical protein N7456_000402 [Penicillium angulare]
MGKDRTGVIFALILSLAGVPREIVAAEYSMSEEGLKHQLPHISTLVQKAIPPSVKKHDVDMMAQQVIKSSADSMSLALQMIEDVFGGIAEYPKDRCGLTGCDIGQIENLLLEDII